MGRRPCFLARLRHDVERVIRARMAREEEPMVELSAATTTQPAGMRGHASPAVLLPEPLHRVDSMKAMRARAHACAPSETGN
jgi:hypothetical protein